MVENLRDSLYSFGDNYLIRNKQGIWELYLSGNPLQLGLNSGALTRRLYHRQDSLLFTKLKDFVPSERKQRFLYKFLKWFNRDIDKNILPIYRAELYGQSCYADSLFDYIAPKYERSLYLHSAHDIGHALQDLMLVGCSSLAAWGRHTEGGKLLIGRNFDFYLSDDFATEKIVRFVRPTQGYPFMSYAWGGMIGVMSGMNTEGLTVTINAGKSNIPLKARTPISLLCREILQFATTTGEAIAIAKKRKVFVSEAIMVGSAKEGKAILIEVSPKKFGVYEVDNGLLLCANHFQSTPYLKDKKNRKQIAHTHTAYRYKKMQELVSENERLTPKGIAAILRNTEGLEGRALGYGNEKALNQLLAHHSVIFSPEERIAWVSTAPYQLGEFVAYDLKEIFKGEKYAPHTVYPQTNENIPADPFLYTQAYRDYEAYRYLEQQLSQQLREKTTIQISDYLPLTFLNPDYWKGYYLLGEAYWANGQYEEAKEQYKIALTKEIPYTVEKERIEKRLKD
jgi:peptidase C45, acyl-coenzyme A:6-aminopenicillanic acid acyl-transferase